MMYLLNSKVTTNDIFKVLPLVSCIFHFSWQKDFHDNPSGFAIYYLTSIYEEELPNPQFVIDALALHVHVHVHTMALLTKAQ